MAWMATKKSLIADSEQVSKKTQYMHIFTQNVKKKKTAFRGLIKFLSHCHIFSNFDEIS